MTPSSLFYTNKTVNINKIWLRYRLSFKSCAVTGRVTLYIYIYINDMAVLFKLTDK